MFDKYGPPGWSSEAQWVEPVTKNDHGKNVCIYLWYCGWLCQTNLYPKNGCLWFCKINLNHKDEFNICGDCPLGV